MAEAKALGSAARLAMSPGRTTSGVGDVSSLSWSHAARVTVPSSTATSVAWSALRVWYVGFVIVGAPLEAQRETRGEVADVRGGEEVGGAEVRLRPGVDLGIEAAVLGPGVQVAACEGEHGRSCTSARRKARRKCERQRDLAELGE